MTKTKGKQKENKKAEHAKKQRGKQKRIDFKSYDIIPLVNQAWEDSFARKESNLKAIVERGCILALTKRFKIVRDFKNKCLPS